MCDSLTWTPMNRREKFDAASFILSGEIRNGTNTQKQTNKRLNDTSNTVVSELACIAASGDELKTGQCQAVHSLILNTAIFSHNLANESCTSQFQFNSWS